MVEQMNLQAFPTSVILEELERRQRVASEQRILLTFTIDVELTAEEVWADNNIPAGFNVNDIHQEIALDGGPRAVLADWSLLQDPKNVSVEVEVIHG